MVFKIKLQRQIYINMYVCMYMYVHTLVTENLCNKKDTTKSLKRRCGRVNRLRATHNCNIKELFLSYVSDMYEGCSESNST